MQGRSGLSWKRARRGSLVTSIALVSIACSLVIGTAGEDGADGAQAAVSGPQPRQQPPEAFTSQREVRELRTERSKTFRALDGTYVARVFAVPIHFKEGGGDWEEIDDTLVKAADGRFKNRANRFRVALPDRLGDGAIARCSRALTAWS